MMAYRLALKARNRYTAPGATHIVHTRELLIRIEPLCNGPTLTCQVGQELIQEALHVHHLHCAQPCDHTEVGLP
jgi:hypothetical protein